MEAVASFPALIKMFSVFGLVLFLNSRPRVGLSLSLLVGSLILGMWMGLSPYETAESIIRSLVQSQTLALVFIVGAILLISRLLKESGHLDRIIRTVKDLSRDDRTAGTIMPALIGLLPMPGGALFSAPMVDAALCRHGVPGEKKTALNYWFRHIWEYFWPVYPGFVLAVALLDVETWRFMALMWPMTVLMAAVGVVFILLPLGKMSDRDPGRLSWKGMRALLREIVPIGVVVLVIAILAGAGAFLSLLGMSFRIPGAMSILIGLLVSLVWIYKVNHLSMQSLWRGVLDKNLPRMLLLVAAIMVFKGMMGDSRAVLEIREELVAYKIPALTVILMMPFLSGIITGIAIGFVGASFPLIIPLFPSPPGLDYLTYAGLAYTFGAMGMMLSPVHLCLLVTKDYFKADLLHSYRYLFFPALAVMAISLPFFWLVRVLGHLQPL